MGTPKTAEALETTHDHILGGQVRLEQPRSGYRAAIDPVLLAASIQAKAGEIVLDAGLGVGAASLCLAKRLDGPSILGVEVQLGLSALAQKNVTANSMEERIQVVTGNIDDPALSALLGRVDQIMTNPPYEDAEKAQASPNSSKDRAHREADLDIGGWIKACRRFLKHKGRITVIYRADRLDDLLAALNPQFGDIRILPLLPDPDPQRPAKRVIVTARNGVKTPLMLLPGVILHNGQGGYMDEIAKILSGKGTIRFA